MAWSIKTSSAPTLDGTKHFDTLMLFGGALFMIDGSDTTPRVWDGTSRECSISYDSLASIGADPTKVIRVTGSWSYFPSAGDLDLGAGVALFGPGDDDASIVTGVIADPNGPIVGSFEGRAIENGVLAPVSSTPVGGTPSRMRLYWNGTGGAFVIPDAGFGSHSIPANTQSWWGSDDGGVTWAHVADRTIAAGVVPTQFACVTWLGTVGLFGSTQITIGSFELAQDEPPPPDTNPPAVSDRDPAPDETRVDPAGPFSVTITDTGSGVDASSVILTLHGTVVWTGDAEQPGYTVVKTTVANGYDYEVTPDSPLPWFTLISFRAQADDLAPSPNSLDTTWEFVTDEAPEAPGGSEGPFAVTASIKEGESGEFTSAYDGYDFIPPYDNGSYVRLRDDGYDFVIRKTGDLGLGQITVNVTVDGYQDALYNVFPPQGAIDRPRASEIRFRVVGGAVPVIPFEFEGLGGWPSPTFKLYAYTIETGVSIQIYESDDDGANWSLHSTLASGITEDRVGQGFRRLHGNSSDQMFAAAQEMGVYRWDGSSWTQVLVAGSGSVPAGTRFLSVNALGQYVAAVGHDFAGTPCAMMSNDYGITWGNITADLITGTSPPLNDNRLVPRQGTPITKLSSVMVNYQNDGYRVAAAGSDAGGGVTAYFDYTNTYLFPSPGWTIRRMDDGGDGLAVFAGPYEWFSTGTTVGGVAQIWERFGNLGTTLASPQASYTSIVGDYNWEDIWVGSSSSNVVSHYDGSSWTDITIPGGIDQIHALFGNPDSLALRQLWIGGADAGSVGTCIQSDRPPVTSWTNRNIGIASPRICLGLFGTYL